jgi:hypothetical protein
MKFYGTQAALIHNFQSLASAKVTKQAFREF